MGTLQCELGAMVTVVDASTFMEDFRCAETLRQREDLGEWQKGDLVIWGGNRRRVVDLLTAQVGLCPSSPPSGAFLEGPSYRFTVFVVSPQPPPRTNSGLLRSGRTFSLRMT